MSKQGSNKISAVEATQNLALYCSDSENTEKEGNTAIE